MKLLRDVLGSGYRILEATRGRRASMLVIQHVPVDIADLVAW
jgi:hypothetical protein